MIYHISKTLWLVAQPGNLLKLLLAGGLLLLVARRWRLGLGLVLVSLALTLTIAVLPIGTWLLAPLESRFPPLTRMPDHVDGVIMLGGTVGARFLPAPHQALAQTQSERLAAFVALARRYPQARLIFAGGGPPPENDVLAEADAVRELLKSMDIDMGRVVFERRSRNTFENVVYAKALAHPTPDEIWILVTSSSHMPRAVGLFRGQGWQVVADPVDYDIGTGSAFHIDYERNLDQTTGALKEWLGMLANWWLGRSRCDFAGPLPAPGDAAPASGSFRSGGFDLGSVGVYRKTWGVFRDRRPDLYGALGTLDGRVAPTRPSFSSRP